MSLFQQTFMVNALLGGTGIALACGLVGYFLVLRAQVFTGDALSHVAFTGSLAALAFGINLRVGLFAASIGVALLLGALGRRGRADDVVIGNVFAWILGLGVFFLTLYTTNQSGGGNGTATVNVLFGSIFGLTGGQPWAALWIGAGVLAVMTVIARPLLFASLDEAVAAARGVPVRLLGYGFLALVGATTAEATQAVGALLLLGLLAAPAGTALLLTDRPFRGMAIAAGLALAEMWGGLLLAYYAPRIPPSFSITAVATAVYAAAFAAHRLGLLHLTNSNPEAPWPPSYAEGNNSVKASEFAPSP
jgi:zinc/manganese transport system permease protein